MNPLDTPEVWLRGPVEGIPPLLQPVAHALLQAREEVEQVMQGFRAEWLWERPAGLASAGFHLQHLAGVLSRLFTYARSKSLSHQQLQELEGEGKPGIVVYLPEQLLHRFSVQVNEALQQLSVTSEQTLTEPRPVGRKGLPSTVLGLLFHAAEHTQRHVGQLLVTAAIIRANKQAAKMQPLNPDN